MDKIKRLINCHVNVTACNFRCEYCYIATRKKERNRLPEFKYTPEYIGRAFSKKRIGGVCLFNICGSGETLIPKEVPQIIIEILKQGHYVEVVTNGTLTERIKEILRKDKKLMKRLEFKMSFHYLELKKHGLIDIYFENINLIKAAGASFSVEITPCDTLIPYIEEIKELCKEKTGAFPHITIARDDATKGKRLLSKLPKDEYKKIWDTFESPMFQFKWETFGVKRQEYCYAGDWSIFVDLETGIARQCYCSRFEQNIFENIKNPIIFLPIGKYCTEPHCYNAHAFMTLGNIPQVKSKITYAEIRNRICVDGTEWLQPQFKKFISGHFYENNKQYSIDEKKVKDFFVYCLNKRDKLKRSIKRVVKSKN